MNDKTYDTLKLIGLIFAPVSTFIAALISIWNIPYSAQITATLAALDTLIGALVVIAKAQYDKSKKSKAKKDA